MLLDINYIKSGMVMNVTDAIKNRYDIVSEYYSSKNDISKKRKLLLLRTTRNNVIPMTRRLN